MYPTGFIQARIQAIISIPQERKARPMRRAKPFGNRGDWRLDRLQALLFDMDGVITDSMPYHYEAWRRIFERYGIHVSREEILKREGERGLVTLETLLSGRGLELSRDEIRKALEDKEALFQSLARPALFPGAEMLVRTVRERGKKIALVTGTSGREARANLPARVLGYFDVLVSGDMVSQGKPHPEPYRMALRLLGTAPDESLVIENAPYGILSAKGAGLPCVALTTSLPAEHLQDADRVVRDLEELQGILLGSSLSVE
jgi:beta-phosphoglucomutase